MLGIRARQIQCLETSEQTFETLALRAAKCRNYSEIRSHFAWTRLIVEKLGFYPENIGGLKDKKIVDLGCGSNEFIWKPWTARFLHAAGAQVVGIDCNSLEGEKFTYHMKDLSIPGELSFLKSDTFDIAICKGVVAIINPLHGDSTPNLKLAPGIDITQMSNELFSQIERLLKDGGVAFATIGGYLPRLHGVFRKANGKLVLEKPI